MERIRNASPAAKLAATVAIAAAVQLVLLGEWLFHGGMFTDDWPIASVERFGGTRELLSDLTAANSDRPLGNVYLTLTSAVSGTDPQLHALWGFLTHLACVVAVFYAARALEMRLATAAAFGLLVMLFPYSDSIWLWYAASHSSLAIAFGAVGVILAVRGLASTPAWPWHLGAAVAFMASVVTYQVIAVTAILMLALYWPRAGSRRAALLLWAKDLAAIAVGVFGPSLIYGARGENASPLVESGDEAIAHAEQIADQGFDLLAAALVPFGDQNVDAIVLVAICVIAAGAAVALWGPADISAGVRRSLTAILLGVAIVVTAFVIYVPATPAFYQPLVGGGGNRINALPGIGYCLIVVALATLTARLIAAIPGFPRTATTPLALLLVLVVTVGYGIKVHGDIDDWSRAADVQVDTLARLDEIGRPAEHSTNFVFGGVGETAPGVFSFRVSWDLNNAVRLHYDDYDYRTYPIFEGTRMRCLEEGLYPDGLINGLSQEHGGIYAFGTYFTDLRTGEQVRVDNQAECRREARRFVPGPPTGG